MSASQINTEQTDCITNWKDELENVSNELIKAQGEATKTTNAYQAGKEWCDKLKIFWENIQETDELATQVTNFLENFINHSGKLTVNADQTVTAIKILLCDIQEVLTHTQNMKWVTKCVIDQINDLDHKDVSKSKLLVCLGTLLTKLDAAYNAIIDTLIKATITLEHSFHLFKSLGEDAGLQKNLNTIEKSFTSPDAPEYCMAPPANGSCTATLPDKPVFPLNNGNAYYATTENQYTLAKMELATLEQEMNDALKKMAAYKASRDSLDAAIKAAEKAKDCK